jgi:RHS repeat-associated protein
LRRVLKDFELSGGAPFGFQGCVLSSQQVPQTRATKTYKTRQTRCLRPPASYVCTGAQSVNRTYTYDHLNRLQTMSSVGDPSGCTRYSWTYDAWGNRTAQTGTSGTNCNQASTGYNTKNQITSPTGFMYDANGNLSNDTLHTYTYDAENRLVSVDGGATASYIYSVGGMRLQKSVGSTTLTYLYDLSGRVVAEDNGTSWGPGYVYMGSQLLALYSQGTTYFVHADHLGSSRVLTAMNQSVYDKPDYLPFGEQIAGDTGTSHKFTGYPRDADTGLDYASARYYGSRLGRFLSPDPLGMGASNSTNPQSLNQYAYVGNNPTNLTDPGGMDWCDILCGIGGGIGGGPIIPGPSCDWCGETAPPPSLPANWRDFVINDNWGYPDATSSPDSLENAKTQGDQQISNSSCGGFLKAVLTNLDFTPNLDDFRRDFDNLRIIRTPAGDQSSDPGYPDWPTTAHVAGGVGQSDTVHVDNPGADDLVATLLHETFHDLKYGVTDPALAAAVRRPVPVGTPADQRNRVGSRNASREFDKYCTPK